MVKQRRYITIYTVDWTRSRLPSSLRGACTRHQYVYTKGHYSYVHCVYVYGLYVSII